ncbi:hypothetical protein ABT299_30250 [Spirillospora sp. NPDC000708]
MRDPRLHGGPNRAWLADVIEQGLADGVLRRAVRYQPHPDTPRKEWPSREMGWDEATALLRARDDEPTVVSSSFCDRFPNEDIADWTSPADVDLTPDWATDAPGEWAELGRGRQRRLAEHATQRPVRAAPPEPSGGASPSRGSAPATRPRSWS